MPTIELTNGGFATVDEDDYEFLSKYRWHRTTNGITTSYARCSSGDFHHMLMHRVIMARHGYHIAGKLIDHRDRNGLNDQKENLRVATKSQNGMNRGRTRSNKTGLKVVSASKSTGRYAAYIAINGKNMRLGTFDTPQDAAKAYETAALTLHGEFACV